MSTALTFLVCGGLLIVIAFNQLHTKTNVDLRLTLFRILGYAIISFTILSSGFFYFEDIFSQNNIALILCAISAPSLFYLFLLYFLTYKNYSKKTFIIKSILFLIPYFLHLLFLFILLIISPIDLNKWIMNLTDLVIIIYLITSITFCIQFKIVFIKTLNTIFVILPFIVSIIYYNSILYHQIYWLLFWFLPTIFLTSFYSVVYLSTQDIRIYIDDITKLPNRRLFIMKLMSIYKNQEPMMIIFLSLISKNENSSILLSKNNNYIIHIADYLSSHYQFVYQYSKNDFMLIVPNDLDISDFSDEIDLKFKKGIQIGDQLFRCEFNIIALDCLKYAFNHEEAMLLLESIITTNKYKERKIVICNDLIKETFTRKALIFEILKKAIINDEIIVYFQPLYDNHSKKYIGVEALTRVMHEGKMLSPNEFIPIAEQTGLIVELDLLVFKHVLDFLINTEKQGINLKAASINFSPLLFTQANLVNRVNGLLEKYNVDPKKIAIEMTESVFLDNYDEPRKIMLELNKLGIQFHLDDFGTGFSNYSILFNLPFSMIKIDKSLLYEAINSDNGFRVLNSLYHSFKDNGKKVLIEGVEFLDHYQLVMNLGNVLIQGFYFAKPMPEDETLNFLKKGVK